MEVVGILLAAGRGRRFDPTGTRLKLLEPGSAGSAPGEPMALGAARALRAAVDTVLAVVGGGDAPQQVRLRALLESAGCTVVPCRTATAEDDGMGLSIASALALRPQAGGWIIALADMPDIAPSTIAAVRAAIEDGADSAAPYFRGTRGHPVGFGAVCGPALAALRGDTGARAVLQRFAPLRIDVDDPGVLRDIDTPAQQ